MLTIEQQLIIKDSMWVVNTVLKELGLQKNDDLRQQAYLYMCECLERFDPSLNVKWNTYAYKSIYLYVKRMRAREIKKQSREIPNETVIGFKGRNLALDDAIKANASKTRLEYLKQICSPNERRLLDLKLQGYKVKEISVRLGCSISQVSRYMSDIKAKALQQERSL